MKDEALSPTVSMSKKAFNRLTEASLKKSTGRHSLVRGGLETASSGGLDRTFSQVSISSVDSSHSVASSATAGKWSPRTTDSPSKHAKSARVLSKRSRNVVHSTLSPEGSANSLDLLPDSPERPKASSFIAASRPQTAESQPAVSNEHSSTSSPHRTGSAALHSQHSILDPLPEQPTDVVRKRKVFGSTFSVGKLGELPYTPLPRQRGALYQPPWVAAAARPAPNAQPQTTLPSNIQHSSSLQGLPAEHRDEGTQAEPHSSAATTPDCDSSAGGALIDLAAMSHSAQTKLQPTLASASPGTGKNSCCEDSLHICVKHMRLQLLESPFHCLTPRRYPDKM